METQFMPLGLLTILFKHRRAVLTVFLTVVLSAVAYLLIATPKYESMAELIVRFGDRSIPEVNRTPQTELTPSDRHEIVLAHAAMLSSHDLAEQTINAIGLDKVYPDVVDDPPTRWSPMDEGIKRFLDKLSVDVGTQDNIITVSYLHPDKKLSHDIVQKLIDLYISQQTRIYQNPQSDFISGEVKAAGDRLAKAQSTLEAFKNQWQITDYDQEVQDLLKQRGDVDTALRGAQANLGQAQHRQKEITALIKNVPATQPETAGGEKYRSVDDAESRLADLKAKQSQMLATYSSNSTALSSLNEQIRTAEAEAKSRRSEVNSRNSSNPNVVYQTLQTDLLRTSADAESNAEPVRVLMDQMQTITQRLSDLQHNRGKFDDLLREHQIAEDAYRSLSNQFEDARVKDSLNKQRISPAALLSQPTYPYKTARPRKLITIVAALVGGMILAVGTALFLEAKDDRFTSAEQVAYLLELPVLASLERPQRPIVRGLLTYGGVT
jgi:succinoglycan biosynthesis transport protein ExoP